MRQDVEIHTLYSRNRDVSMFPPLLGLSQFTKHIQRPRLTHSLTKYEMEFQCKVMTQEAPGLISSLGHTESIATHRVLASERHLELGCESYTPGK